MREAGYPFQKEWFAPHFEFRFPAIGSHHNARAFSWNCAHALEPWNVLGEEASAGGTARNVDSSVERLQVKVSGMIDSAVRRAMQRAPRAAASDRNDRRIRGWRALSGVAAAVVSAPQHPGSFSAGV